MDLELELVVIPVADDGFRAVQVTPQPERASYGSFLSFQDTEGNGWTVQEITTRLPGR